MKLFVDDFRACPDGWVLARTIGEAVRLLASGYVDEVSLDYDIRRCSNKRCRESKDDSFEAVYLYILAMGHRPSISIHTGNVVKGKEWAAIFGIPYNYKIGVENDGGLALALPWPW